MDAGTANLAHRHEVDVERDVAGGSLDHGDRSRKGLADRAKLEDLFGFPAEESEHGVQEGAVDLTRKGSVVSQKIAKWKMNAEYPVSNRCIAENVVDQERSAIAHSTTKARGAPAAPLAPEPDQPVETAAPAPDAGEALGEDSAGQVLLELPLDEGRHGAAFLLAEIDEGPVVRADDAGEVRLFVCLWQACMTRQLIPGPDPLVTYVIGPWVPGS